MDIFEKIKLEKDHEVFSHKCFVCEIKRHPDLKHLCRYVYLPQGHPSFGEKDPYYSVHGGITASFADNVLQEWIIGFDCAHAGDFSPGMNAISSKVGIPHNMLFGEDTYRDWEYVQNEIYSLVDQLLIDVDEDKITEWNMTIENRFAIKLLSQ